MSDVYDICMFGCRFTNNCECPKMRTVCISFSRFKSLKDVFSHRYTWIVNLSRSAFMTFSVNMKNGAILKCSMHFLLKCSGMCLFFGFSFLDSPHFRL